MYSLNKMGINKQACDVCLSWALSADADDEHVKKNPNGSGFIPWETFWSSVATLSQHLPSV